MQAGARLAGQMGNALNPDFMERGHGPGRNPQRSDRQAGNGFRSAAGWDMHVLAVARDRPAASRRIGNRGPAADPRLFETLAQVFHQRDFTVEEMRRPRDINEHAIGRVRRDERRIHHAPEAEAVQRRFILFRFCLHDGQIRHEGLRVRHRHPTGEPEAFGRPVHAREHAALAFHARRYERLIPRRRVFALPPQPVARP